ncbi:beta-glucosidase BglX [Hymenobacter metallicola]|uniref:Periplasmic beta-glucosidase n=1 Tax=Hymenobacter metallicola TaxID=2563114 RepID=A0A4Z0Q0I7_9BACT|nr:beta-glucosidase BglX [Hymenobacter metallicola]TGE23477.1 beta-glucosidase BglX [Hymenobacter metallicola]
MKPTFRTAVLLSLGLLLGPALHAQKAAPRSATSTTIADDPKMQRFIDELMSKMTLEEKIGQLNLITVGFDVTGPVVSKDVDANIRKGLVGGVFNTYTPVAARKLQEMAIKESRLHIPLIFGYDVIHGHRTIFPIPLGLSATWDMAAVERSARVAAEESAADGLHWVFSPMVDIARDPRWGRIAEGGGEDPYLGSELARAMVRGYQGPGNDLTKNNTVMACLKHFALYGAAEAGRDYNTTDMSLARMYNEYLPPYKAAVEAGVGSVMSSFNDINGVPATGNKWLLTDLLRRQWGFKGFVATDYTAINEMVNHGVGNDAQVSAMALNAGADQDMVGEVFLKNLAQNLKDGTVTQETIDQACRRVLEGKYKLGLFKDPYRGVSEKRAKATLMKKEFLDDARDVARKSFVLLKNDNNALPLKKAGTIALVGPLATRQRDLIGSWSGAGDWKQAVSVEQGIRNVAGSSVKIVTAQGANFTDDALLVERLNAYSGDIVPDKRPAEEMIREAVLAAQGADVVVAVVGESQGMTGEAASRADIGLPAPQLELLKALKKTGKPLVVVLMNGRPLTLNWEQQNADAILETWFAGTQGGNAIADVLFGAYNPSGKLTATFPQSVGQVPLYYNHKMTGRPFDAADPKERLAKYKSRYLDISNEPLYPFGYGLSYTSFSFSKPELSSATISPGSGLDVKVTIKNTGNFDGEEVAQLYLRDVAGSVSRPVRELKGFQKVMLKKGESRTLTFHVSPDDLKFYNNDLQWVAEPGEFQIFIGPNSRDTQQASFKLVDGQAAN